MRRIFNYLPNYRCYDDTTGTFQTEYKKPLKNYRIYGNSVQEGIPTIDNPIEVQSVGDFCGNLCPDLDIQATGASYEYYENGFKATTTSNKGGWSNYVHTILLDMNTAKWGETYTISCFFEASNTDMVPYMRVGYTKKTSAGFQWTDFNRKWIGNNNNTVLSSTFTLPAEPPSDMYEVYAGVRLWFNIQTGALDECGTITVTDIMLNEGETAEPYHPYSEIYKIPIEVTGDGGSTLHNIYLDKPLMKVGEYSDYIDFKRGKVVRHIYAKHMTYSTSWSTAYYPTVVLNLPVNEWSYPYFNLVLSNYATSEYIDISNGSGSCVALRKCGTYWNITNRDELKSWLDEHPDMYAYYPLITPIETDIELPQIFTKKGTNMITVQTEIQPSKIEIQYLK